MTVSRTVGTEPRTADRADVAMTLDAAAELVGPERVVRLPAADSADTLTLGPNVSLFRSREVGGVVRPRTAEQVRQVVELFSRQPAAGGLHVYSTGRNWGLGSREPAVDHPVVLDLTDLDRVRDIDVAAGWAVIEPGVTQTQLADLLVGTDRMINVTVSSAHTSVLGNALDRGVGLRHQRVEDLVGLEVVLPDGSLVHLGWWPDPDRPTPVYPHGLGPSLVQFFVQSNFGVVTAAAVRLLPRPEELRVVRLNFVPAVLPAAIDLLRRWVAQGLVSGVLKAYNPAAARAYQGRPGEFLVHVCVDGTAASVAALTTVIIDEATSSGLFSEVSQTDATDPAAPNHEVARLVEAGYAGDPDRADVLFNAKLGQCAEDLDERAGFLFFLPLVPFTGQAIGQVDELLDQIETETGVRAGVTLNALNADLIDCVVSIKFDRHEADVDQMHRALDLLYQLFADAGFVPYRLDIEHCEWVDRFTPDPAARDLVRRLKRTIDPQGVIAPGRYR